MRYYQRPPYTSAQRAERTRELVRYFTIVALLLAFCGLLSSCAALPDGPAEAHRAERMSPDPVGLHPASVPTYTTADRWEAPVPVDTVRGW